MLRLKDGLAGCPSTPAAAGCSKLDLFENDLDIEGDGGMR